MSGQSWTTEQLLAELERYERALVEANLTPETVQSDVDRAHRFVGWLDGEYVPADHADRPHYRYALYHTKG
jgi:hypothetical protein